MGGPFSFCSLKTQTLVCHETQCSHCCCICRVLLLLGRCLRPSLRPKRCLGVRRATLGGYRAYLNNAPRATDGQALSKVPGPRRQVHSAWMMTSAALVLFMTLPGLALFYGGLVRRKNVLSILAQCFGLAGGVTILWWGCGYSLTFAPGNGVIGDLRYAFLHGVGVAPNPDYAQWVSHKTFLPSTQLMFAIITLPALISGRSPSA